MTLKNLYEVQFLARFLHQEVDLKRLDELVTDYLKSNDNLLKLQDFIGESLHHNILWVTTIGLIDAMEVVIEDAKSNGNIK